MLELRHSTFPQCLNIFLKDGRAVFEKLNDMAGFGRLAENQHVWNTTLPAYRGRCLVLMSWN